MGVTEIAAGLGGVKSDAHRLLQGLVALQYVSRNNAAATYKPSLRIWSLGSSVLASSELPHAAEPVMHWLLEETGERVFLSLLEGDEIVYLHKIDSPDPVHACSQVGGRAAAHLVSMGMAIVAFQDRSFQEGLAERIVAHTAHALCKRGEFLAELAATRARGYAINRGAWREGFNGVAAPIWDSANRVIAAIGASGPAQRLNAHRFRSVGEFVVTAAANISKDLSGGNRGDAMRGTMNRMVAWNASSRVRLGRSWWSVLK